jgi:8-oxo-dGTP diphosphatase
MIVVDVANVMGARPDGWWRDRAAAAARLGREVAALADRGIEPDADADADAGADAGDGAGAGDGAEAGRSFPAYVVVLEGQARAAAPAIATDSPRVRVVSAVGSGDDAIVDEVAGLDGSCLVVTADRELRRRCEALGASVSGPGWLLRLL